MRHLKCRSTLLIYKTMQYDTIQYNTIQYNTIQYDVNFRAKKSKRKPPLITVAGVALKGQANLISIMVPLRGAGTAKENERE